MSGHNGLLVCWFMVVVGFGTIVVAVVPGLGDSEVVAERKFNE